MTTHDWEQDPEAENIRARLAMFAEFMRLWNLRCVARRDEVTAADIERMRDTLHAIHGMMPDILEPTYHSVSRVLRDTEFLVLQRENGYDVTGLWSQVIQRGLCTADHIKRMQGLAVSEPMSARPAGN